MIKQFLDFLNLNNINYQVNSRLDSKRRLIKLQNSNFIISLHLINDFIEQPDKLIEELVWQKNHAKQTEKIIHIWEDQWESKQEIVKARVLAFAGKNKTIFARKTSIQAINKIDFIDFLKRHHLNIPINTKHKFALVHEGEIVSVIGFGKKLLMKDKDSVHYSYELIRHCNKSGITVTGGMSKLIKHFINTFSPDDIMTYIDKDWGNGRSYLMMNFKKVGEIPPQEFWINTETYERIYTYHYDKLDESQKHDYAKIYNSGSDKLVLDIHN
ncbi:hypothetical protein [Aureibacter tunicatorum]|uniref:Uncharacterized protein n=1 Tax=Aureibacter tunicatorum TaxID=866807 RepID=A0AAE4BTF7_9BACT|nr:hypothetical protein [Aureibacter tunicatorum]MDR6239788.1 hypothetical protein [Aureibacter tunicatorum]BDD04263.1 hypothetical protein AUTU_17460 [Aureibacter tunicatorum]